MNTWSVVFLGIIAVATLATAIVQIGLLISAGLLTRRVGRFVDELDQEIKPVLGHLQSMSKDASRAAAIAVAQVERVDALCSDVVVKIDRTISTIHAAVEAPAREGRAWIIGFQAVMAALREFRSNSPRSRARDEDDGLFI